MPYTLTEKVESELVSMVRWNYKKVDYSVWASTIVVAPKKKSNDIRICVEFKKTLNQTLDSDYCDLPLPEDIFACLSDQEYFCVIDLKGAYQQLNVSEMSHKLLVINTHLSLFCYTRLTYGVS